MTPKHLHLVTVGTSVLSNCGWKRGDPLPAKGETQRAVAVDPRKASAELNALLHYAELRMCDRVHLIATDTPEGRFCRDVVGAYAASKGIPTEQGVEADLLPADTADPYAAAAHLRDRIFAVAESAHERGDAIFLNLTGGLKAETAVAAAAATLLMIAGVPITAYYAHESMIEPVELPILSLRGDLLNRLRREFVSDHVSLRAPLDAGLRVAERERIIQVQTNAEGVPSSARLTEFGRFLVNKLSLLTC